MSRKDTATMIYCRLAVRRQYGGVIPLGSLPLTDLPLLQAQFTMHLEQRDSELGTEHWLIDGELAKDVRTARLQSLADHFKLGRKQLLALRHLPVPLQKLYSSPRTNTSYFDQNNHFIGEG